MCSSVCTAVAVRCTDGACALPAYGFEQSDEGARIDVSSTEVPVLTVGTPPVAITGKRALSFHINATGGMAHIVAIRIPVCLGGATANIANKSFVAQYLFDGPAAPVNAGVVSMHVFLAVNTTQMGTGGSQSTSVTPGEIGTIAWNPLTDANAPVATSVIVSFLIAGAEDWVGTVWLDNVSVL